MSRIWPIPPGANTLHVVGDTQGITSNLDWLDRAAIVQADMTHPSVPDVAYRVQVGDLVSGVGNPDLFPAAIALMDSMGTGQWWACVGNHDYDAQSGDLTPTPEDAAVSMGMPGINFSVDLDYAVLIVTYVRAGSGTDPTSYDPTWLTAELAKYPNRLCLIVAHAPLLVAPEGPEILAALDASLTTYPNQRVAWLCGHTHIPIVHADIAFGMDTGSHTIAHINGSATAYTVPDVDWTDRLCTTWLTVWDDRLEVRFRDHGAHQWVGGGADQSRVWIYTF